MSVTHVLVASIVSGLLALTILGTIARRWALCRTFPLYLTACFSGNALITLWPGRYWTPEFYALKETVYGGLQMAVALELAVVILRRFPRALMRVLVRFLGVLAVGAIMAAVPRPSYFQALTLGLPLEQACVSWMFLILLFAVIWHRIPLGAYHRDLLGGFVFYVGAFATLLGATAGFGWPVFTLCLQSLDPVAFAMTVGIWAAAAWREDEEGAARRGPSSSPRGKRFLLVAAEALACVSGLWDSLGLRPPMAGTRPLSRG
jgi:hypothetical protein